MTHRLPSLRTMGFALLAAATWALPAAASAPPDPLRHALIIGVSSYADARVPVLPGVPADMLSARRIAQAMGIPEANITELRDAQATKPQVVTALRRLGERAGDGSRVLVYFSGHGTRWFDAAAGGCVEGLLTHDGQAIVNREFASLAQPLGAKADKVMIMFDACHSGGLSSLRNAPATDLDRPLRPKFFVKADATPSSCSRPANMRTRSLLGAGVDQLPENVVQITSSRPDEVSFDEDGKGGLATQGVRDCMLGQARDLDGSGAITLAEIEACAQDFVRRKVSPWPDLLPHHVSVRGLRNLIPVPVAVAPPAASATGTPGHVSAEQARMERERLTREQAERAEQQRLFEQQQAAARAEQLRLEQARLVREQSETDAQALAALLAEQLRAEKAAAEQALQEQRQREEQARQREQADRLALAAARPPGAETGPAHPTKPAGPSAAPPVAAPAASTSSAPLPPAVTEPAPVAAVAALSDLYAQRDPRHTVVAQPVRSRLKIGQDLFELDVKSSRGGYLYIVLLGSDETSFYLLFPNAMDRANRLQPGVTLRLPRAHWQVQAPGPAGVDHLLVMVTESPRDLQALSLAPADAAAPFTYTAAHSQGRSRLINFMLGEGVRQGSARFGAAWLQIEETP